jgi:hypothetical protein
MVPNRSVQGANPKRKRDPKADTDDTIENKIRNATALIEQTIAGSSTEPVRDPETLIQGPPMPPREETSSTTRPSMQYVILRNTPSEA